jgi:hypothetical protein
MYERMLREDVVVLAEIQWIKKERARAAGLRATRGTGTPLARHRGRSRETA